MQEFVFVYRMPAGHENGADEVDAWNAWLTAIGEDLRDVGRPVVDTATVAEGAVETPSFPLAGYSVVAAHDVAAAEEIAGRCPAVAAGGAVEVGTLVAMPAGHGPEQA